MEDEGGSSVNETEQFIATGRTGRRNAVPDILDPTISTTSAADLPQAIQKLTCGEDSSKESRGGDGHSKETKTKASSS